MRGLGEVGCDKPRPKTSPTKHPSLKHSTLIPQFTSSGGCISHTPSPSNPIVAHEKMLLLSFLKVERCDRSKVRRMGLELQDGWLWEKKYYRDGKIGGRREGERRKEDVGMVVMVCCIKKNLSATMNQDREILLPGDLYKK